MCKSNELGIWGIGDGYFSIAFVPIAFPEGNALCMVLICVHCPALLELLLASHVSASVIFQASSFKQYSDVQVTREVSNTTWMLLNCFIAWNLTLYD